MFKQFLLVAHGGVQAFLYGIFCGSFWEDMQLVHIFRDVLSW